MSLTVFCDGQLRYSIQKAKAAPWHMLSKFGWFLLCKVILCLNKRQGKGGEGMCHSPAETNFLETKRNLSSGPFYKGHWVM